MMRSSFKYRITLLHFKDECDWLEFKVTCSSLILSTPLLRNLRSSYSTVFHPAVDSALESIRFDQSRIRAVLFQLLVFTPITFATRLAYKANPASCIG